MDEADRSRSWTMGNVQASVPGVCALYGALFALLSALSITILSSVNWRPWRIYRLVAFSLARSVVSVARQAQCRIFRFHPVRAPNRAGKLEAWHSWFIHGRKDDALQSRNGTVPSVVAMHAELLGCPFCSSQIPEKITHVLHASILWCMCFCVCVFFCRRCLTD